MFPTPSPMDRQDRLERPTTTGPFRTPVPRRTASRITSLHLMLYLASLSWSSISSCMALAASFAASMTPCAMSRFCTCAPSGVITGRPSGVVAGVSSVIASAICGMGVGMISQFRSSVGKSISASLASALLHFARVILTNASEPLVALIRARVFSSYLPAIWRLSSNHRSSISRLRRT